MSSVHGVVTKCVQNYVVPSCIWDRQNCVVYMFSKVVPLVIYCEESFIIFDSHRLKRILPRVMLTLPLHWVELPGLSGY